MAVHAHRLDLFLLAITVNSLVLMHLEFGVIGDFISNCLALRSVTRECHSYVLWPNRPNSQVGKKKKRLEVILFT